MLDCRRIHIYDVMMKNAACWMQSYLNCEDLLIERLTVRNHANYNNDGMDLDGCRRVWVHDCDISSGDDALCLKGAGQTLMSDVLIENCRLASACNAFKVGTDTQGDFRRVLMHHCELCGLREDPSGLKHLRCDSGISLEMMDGGTVEDFVLTNLSITDAMSPLFMRLENRGRVQPGEAKPQPGQLRRVLIQHVTGSDNGPRGSYFLGTPERDIEDVCLFDVTLAQLPGQAGLPPEALFRKIQGLYPDAHMIDAWGNAPAFALWVEHVRALTLNGYRVVPMGTETRPEYSPEPTA